MSIPLERKEASLGSDPLLLAAFNATADAFVVVDSRQRVQHINTAACALLGVAAGEAVGRWWHEVVDFVAGGPSPGAAGVGCAGRAMEADHATVRVRDGGQRVVAARIEAVASGAADGLQGALITLRAHDPVAALKNALDGAEQRLRIALAGGQVGLWEWQVDSDVLRESGHWVGRTAHTAAAAVGSGQLLLDNTHPDDLERVRQALIAHLRGETEHYEVEQRVRLLEGGYVRFLVRGQFSDRGSDGRARYLMGTYTDITALREQEQLLRFALESSQQGIWEWNIAANRIVEHRFWRPQRDRYAINSPLDGAALMKYAHVDDVPQVHEQVLQHLRGRTDAIEVELRVRRSDGSYGYFLVRGRAPERDQHGRCERIIGTYTEITNIKANERVLQIALENGRQGLFDWEPDADRILFSREWYAMLGYPEGSITRHSDNVQRILHADDRALGRAALVPMLKGEVDDFQVEHRFRHHDGHYLTILSRGRVIERSSDGRAKRVIGTHVDITTLKATEARLRDSRQLLETVLDALPLRVFWKDRDSRYLGCNRRFAEDVGVEPNTAIVGKLDTDLPWYQIAPALRVDDVSILEGARRRITVERQLTPAAGEPIWVETHKVPIQDSGGDIIGVLGIYDDITRRRAHQQQLQVVANALTSGKQSRLLNAVTRAAAELAGADYAFVARINGDGTATVSAYYPNHDIFKGLTYDLAGTPCETAIAEAGCFVGHDVALRYPHDLMLAERGIEAYYGQPLATSDGEVIGLFTMMFIAPVIDRERVRPVIDIFAARAVTELERERTHAELRASEQRLNAAMEGAHQGLWEWDIDSDRLTTFGSRYAGVDERGAPPVGTGVTLVSRVHPDDQARMRIALLDYLRGESPSYACEVRLLGTDLNYQWTLVRGRATSWDAPGRVQRMLGTFTDISALKDSQAALERSQKFLELIVDTVPQAIFWQDRSFRYLGCNRQFAELAGVATPDELLGKTDKDLWWAPQAAHFVEQDQPLLDGVIETVAQETALVTPFGDTRWVDLIKVPIRDSAGTIIGVLGAIHDISVRKRAEEHAQRLSLYDPLTNLPNRRYFGERLEAGLATATRRGICGALLFIDMDQFKRINDTLGHSVGDALLQAVANRLQNVTRQDDMVARLGGDEFVVLLPDLAADMEHAARQARLVADKIHETLGQPYQFDHHQFHITPTIGITLFPEPGKGVEDVLKEADTAMYSGKAAGRNVTRFFHPEMEQNAQERLLLESDLRTAVRRSQLALVFQPQIDGNGRVSGAEVLLRWQHPTRGVISPADFIPIAEERGLIIDIGRWVLEASFATYRRWLDDGRADIGELAINVSSRQFRAETFLEDVEQLLAAYRIPAQRIVFEITESTVIEDVDATIAIMTRLRRLGVMFALDDFGVGYSSLSYLKRLPIDQLKIDRSFIADIGSDRNDEIICQTIVAMGQHLGLQTVAEGVETAAQLEFLKGLRCNRYQGYLFLRPSSEREFLAYCAASSAGDAEASAS
jgi:diguanylate cyclase (GGDEF)-like protein/PAS domain S-box-containing protein